jgi:hypothetical protein
MFLPSELFDGTRVWAGESPVFLSIITNDGVGQVIDVDEYQWMKTYEHLMRVESTWVLAPKSGLGSPLTLVVHLGEQPYYTARTMGAIGSGGSNSIKAYGIGKKRLDGEVHRLWYLPDGSVTLGDDVDDLGMREVYRLGPA